MLQRNHMMIVHASAIVQTYYNLGGYFMIKKSLAVILASVLAMSTLTACGGNTSEDSAAASEQAQDAEQEGTEESSPKEMPDEEVNITVFCAYASEEPHGKYVYEYADAFMAEHPNVKIEVTAVSSNDIYTKLAAMATSPDDLPTLFYTSADQAPSLFDLGLLEDFNNWVDADTLASFANGVVDAATLNGQLAYYPIDIQPSAVIYRTDRFAEAGLTVPKTWDEFLECAKALTVDSDGDGEIDQWGFSMVGSNNSSGQSRFQSYLWSQGFEIVYQDEASGEWKSDIESDEFLKAFSLWTDMNNEYGVVPTGITEIDYQTAANYLSMGYTSMMMGGSNALGVAYSNNPELKGNLGSFPIPGDAPGTMMNTEGYSLCSKASDAEKAAAAEFVKFFNTNDSDMKFWQESGKIPATKTGQEAEYIQGEDYAGFLQTVANGCRPIFNFAGASGLKGALGDAYSGVFGGKTSNNDAVQGLIKAINDLLEDYN